MDWSLKLRQVPQELVRRAKSAAALKGTTLNDFVIEAIQTAVEAENKSKAAAKK